MSSDLVLWLIQGLQRGQGKEKTELKAAEDGSRHGERICCHNRNVLAPQIQHQAKEERFISVQ